MDSPWRRSCAMPVPSFPVAHGDLDEAQPVAVEVLRHGRAAYMEDRDGELERAAPRGVD